MSTRTKQPGRPTGPAAKNFVSEAEAPPEPTAEDRIAALEATVAELQSLKALDGRAGGVAADVAVAKDNISFLQSQGWKARGKV